MFEPELLLWPGAILAAFAALVLIARPKARGRFWGFDLFGGVGVAAGGMAVYESQRDDAAIEIEASDLFANIFDGWPQAVLVAVIAGAAVLLAVILIQRTLPEWQRTVALSGGVGVVIVLAHLWSAGI
ncbi:MAG: hypothetical protein V3R84_00710 [Acidimicrobiia bacterium]